MTETEDLRAYVKSTNAYNTIAELEGAHVVQRRQMKFPNPTGETPIDLDELKHSANRLESLQYNIPLYVQGAADPHADVAAMQDVSATFTRPRTKYIMHIAHKTAHICLSGAQKFVTMFKKYFLLWL